MAASGEDAPLSYVVSPAVYKILSENDDYRVILATWPPGTKDAFHSHPVSFVSYALTDGSRRFHFSEGKSNDATIKKGQVFLPGSCSVALLRERRNNHVRDFDCGKKG